MEPVDFHSVYSMPEDTVQISQGSRTKDPRWNTVFIFQWNYGIEIIESKAKHFDDAQESPSRQEN